MTIDWRATQRRLGITADNIPGPITYNALMSRIAGRPVDQAISDAVLHHAPAYGITDNADRLSGFLGQTCYESGGYKWLRELWGPTAAQRGYEGRKDLGNTHPGDGSLYRGRGLIQITGRENYREAGEALALPLESKPSLAELPDGAVLVALWYWDNRHLNELCDREDWRGLTIRINGGTNGLDGRLSRIEDARQILR